MDSKPDSGMEEFDRLMDQLLDGELSKAELQRLEVLVLGSTNLKREYVERLHLHGLLQETVFLETTSLDEVIKLESGRVAEVSEQVTRRRARHVPARISWWLPASLAASLVFLVLGWQFGRLQTDSVKESIVAKLVDAKGARWEAMSLPTLPGASINAGRLRLAAGLATIEFESGALVTLEGPAELEIMDSWNCHLHHGTLTAHVPPQAVGFVVNTEHAKLVDHGTEFGVSVDRFGEAQVKVFDGKVELEHHQSGKTLALLSRQGALVGDEDLVRSEREEDETMTAANRKEFPRGPDVMMVSTAEGKGQAGYVWSPGTQLHFSRELLILKNCDQASYRRKAWLGFDLVKLNGRKIRKATLTLMFEATGWGFASLVPEAEFSIYGVSDDSLDDWDDKHLTWSTAPANDVEGDGADLSKAKKLGSFKMPQGVLDGAFSISTDELTTYLNDDGNRFATLIVVRETKESRGGGVVHGFAGNDHPLLRPPTLHLVLEE